MRDEIATKQLIKKKTQNKRNYNHKNEDQIQQKKLKSNDQGLNQKIKSNQKKIKRKINKNQKNEDQI